MALPSVGEYHPVPGSPERAGGRGAAGEAAPAFLPPCAAGTQRQPLFWALRRLHISSPGSQAFVFTPSALLGPREILRLHDPMSQFLIINLLLYTFYQRSVDVDDIDRYRYRYKPPIGSVSLKNPNSGSSDCE